MGFKNKFSSWSLALKIVRLIRGRGLWLSKLLCLCCLLEGDQTGVDCVEGVGKRLCLLMAYRDLGFKRYGMC